MTAKQRGRLIALIVIFLIIIGFIILFSWIVTRGVVDTPPPDRSENSSQSSSEPVETNPNETNIQGGSSGAGTGQPNDETIETPSPAGGVDTNRQTP